VCLPVNELRSNRFERFCERLEMDDSPEKVIRLFGYLCAWYTKWASDPEFDHGILWNVGKKRCGGWSGWPEPDKFGNALEAVGYIKPIISLYKDKDLPEDERQGYIVLNGDGGVALDVSWSGWHRKQPTNIKLSKYLTDPSLSIYWNNKPNEGANTGTSAGAGQNEGSGTSAGGNFSGSPPGYVSGTSPELVRNKSGVSPAALRAPSAPNVNVNVNEETNVSTFNVNEETNSRGAVPVNNLGRAGFIRTSLPKTTAQRDFIRQHKHDNPTECLMQLDPTKRDLWIEAVERDCGFVCRLLGSLVETDETWAKLLVPVAPLMKKLLPHVLRLRKDQRRTT